MTLRELIAETLDWVRETTASVGYWFEDGWGKLIEGNILDLTIGQIAFILFLVWWIFIVIKPDSRR